MRIGQAAAFERLRLAFATASTHREERPDIDLATGEIGWVLYERQQMQSEVNRIRALNCLPPLDEDLLRVAELTSTGHIDYAQKFALRCAELTQQ